MNQIRSSITTVHEIAQNTYDNTILESLQSKVAEILHLQEKIAELEMKLKIEIESNKLQTAEFAFREEEYKIEIKTLKENIEIFQKGLFQSFDKKNSHYYEVDVLLKTEKEKAERLTNKLAKWKSKAKFLFEENEKLQIEIEEIKKNDKENQHSMNQLIECENLRRQSENQRKQLENQMKQLTIQFKQSETKRNQSENQVIQLENQIKHLEKQIKQLEKQIKQSENQRKQSENQVIQLENQIKQSEKLIKQSETQRKQAENQTKQLEVQIKQVKERAEQALIDKDNEIDDIKNNAEEEKKELLARIKKLEQDIKTNSDKFNNKLTNLKNQYTDKLKDKDDELKEDQNQKENQINELNEENDRLRSNIDKLSNHIKELEQKLSSNQKKLRNFELEFDLVAKSLDVTPGKANDHEWDPINNKIKELLEKSEQLDKTLHENEFLRKRLNTATDEIQKQKIIQKTPKEEQDDELIKTLQLSLHQTRDELEKTQVNLSYYKLRSSFSKLIDHQQSRALNSFLDLHSSIFPCDQSNFRPIILTIIFGLRFPKLAKNKNINFDPRNLLMYRGRSELSFDKKVGDFRQKILDLEHEILFLKQNIEDVKSEASKIVQEKEENSRSANSKINYQYEKQINQLKQQINHLTKELSRHVSSDTYNNVCSNAEKLEGANKTLKEENKKLSNLLDKRNKRYDELKKKFRSYILASDHQAKIYNQTKQSFDDKVKENETLKTLLGEKNKEILALERLVSRHEANNQAAVNSCACIIAENESLNNHLQGNCEQFCESPKCKELRGKCLICSINQEFLGNYNYNYCCC
ncbi:hypothetical protein M9Y10_017365 [Tritrichomonas musculus]|uniref:Uncharacterized protein n=1 Tax=Tritrichomonas musculus TaxID=1915356 RepID=A0ABR2HTK1_9EUKA